MSLTPQRYFDLVPDTVDMTIQKDIEGYNFCIAVKKA